VPFFTDVFTIETWEQAKARGFEVSGFPPPTPARGGYFKSTFERVKIGDVLLCYVKAPAKRWVGALRVESAWYLDDADRVWGVDDEGRARFPARFRVSPILTRDVEFGIPVEETVGVLSCLDERTWSGLFRRSLTPVPEEDGTRLLRLLELERDATPVRIPRKRVRPTVRRSLDSHASTADGDRADSQEAVEREGEQSPRPHLELLIKLIKLGKTLGCDVWVASDERGKSLGEFVVADHVLHEFPSIGLDPESRELVRTIDVLWIRGRGVAAAFEIETTTQIFSGILRMSDLVALQPNTSIDLYIVAPSERAKRVREQIARPTFEAFDPPLRKKCRYLSDSNLERLSDADPRLLRNLPPTVVRDYAEEIATAE
jgi:hypothetical protein